MAPPRRNRLQVLLGGVALLLSAVVAASPLKVPQVQVDSTRVYTYQCEGGKSLVVTYWNSHAGQSFALVPVDGQPMLFVDTVAASGVKYVAGRYTWWTKGNNGNLYDITAGPNAGPIVAGCTAAVGK